MENKVEVTQVLCLSCLAVFRLSSSHLWSRSCSRSVWISQQR